VLIAAIRVFASSFVVIHWTVTDVANSSLNPVRPTSDHELFVCLCLRVCAEGETEGGRESAMKLSPLNEPACVLVLVGRLKERKRKRNSKKVKEERKEREQEGTEKRRRETVERKMKKYIYLCVLMNMHVYIYTYIYIHKYVYI